MHRHSYKLKMYNVISATFQCSCGDMQDRKLTKQGVAKYKRIWKEAERKATGIHKLWKTVSKQIKGCQGWGLMQVMDKLIKKHPEILMSSCDDSYHTTSAMYYIPHEVEGEYWGTTLLVVPQNGVPHEMFLYPHHAKDMLKVLTAIGNKKSKEKGMEKIEWGDTTD
jgi:hypothetical protein